MKKLLWFVGGVVVLGIVGRFLEPDTLSMLVKHAGVVLAQTTPREVTYEAHELAAMHQLDGAKSVRCELTHSASAEVSAERHLDVQTSTNDNIRVVIVGLGSPKAQVFNSDSSRFTLTLRKTNSDALFYEQDGYTDGLIHWVYFTRSQTITYAKIRAFPLTGDPSSYLMLGLCR